MFHVKEDMFAEVTSPAEESTQKSAPTNINKVLILNIVLFCAIKVTFNYKILLFCLKMYPLNFIFLIQ